MMTLQSPKGIEDRKEITIPAYILSEEEYQNLKNHQKDRAEKYVEACDLVQSKKYRHFIECFVKMFPELKEASKYTGYKSIQSVIEYHNKTWEEKWPKFEDF